MGIMTHKNDAFFLWGTHKGSVARFLRGVRRAQSQIATRQAL